MIEHKFDCSTNWERKYKFELLDVARHVKSGLEGVVVMVDRERKTIKLSARENHESPELRWKFCVVTDPLEGRLQCDCQLEPERKRRIVVAKTPLVTLA